MKKLAGILILIMLVVLSGCTMLSPASLEKAEKLRDKDKLDQAIEVYEALIDEDEENLEAWFGLAETYMEMESFLESADTLNQTAEVILGEFDSDEDEFEDAFDDLYGYLEDLDEESVDYDGEYDQIAELMALYAEDVDDRLDISDIGFIYDYATTIVGISLPNRSMMRWEQSGQLLQSELEALGYVVALEYANDSVEEQVEEIRDMIDNQCDVLVIGAVDGHELTDILETAKKAHITVIAYDQLIYDSADVDYYVSFDHYDVGTLQGEYIVSMISELEADSPYNLEIFAGDSESDTTALFYEGAMDVLRPYIQSGQLVVSSDEIEMDNVLTEGWRYDVAYDRMAMLIDDYYEDETVDFVLSPRDSISQGIVDALLDMGYGSYTKPMPYITGQGCDRPSVEDIMEGKQAMSIYQDVHVLADETVQMITAIVERETPEINDDESFDNGEVVVPTFLCQSTVVDINNYEAVLIETGVYSSDELDGNRQVISYALDNTELPELSEGVEVEGYLGAGSVIYYLFIPESDGMYMIESTGDTDTYGTLYHEDSYITENDDSGDGGNFQVQGMLEGGETYTVQVSGYSDSDTGNFTIIVSQPYDADEATSLRVNVPENGFIFAGDEIYYTFVPEMSGVYGLGTTGDTDTYGSLYQNGQLLTANDDRYDSNFHIEYYLIEGETYFIVVEGYSESTTGDYAMLVEAINTDFSDGDQVLALEQESYAYLVPGGINYFTFVPEESGTYYFESHGEIDNVASLYEAGDNISYNDDGGDSGNFKIEAYLVAGIPYMLEVEGFGDTTEGAYYVTVSMYQNTTLSLVDAETVYVNQPLERHLEMGAFDVYAFTPNHNGTYTISTSSELDTFGELYRDGMFIDDNDDGGYDMNMSMTVDMDAGVEYTIVVSGYSESTEGYYTLVVED